jgi:hypothetical protein
VVPSGVRRENAFFFAPPLAGYISIDFLIVRIIMTALFNIIHPLD